jgi:hypothetical protein
MRRRTPAFSRPFRPVTVLAACLLAVACTGAGEDVRVTLCKDIVAVHSGGKTTFERTEVKTPGYQDAQVILAYSTDSARGRATCFYEYNAVEDTADLISDPLRAYSASPSRVVINGDPLSPTDLARVIGESMLQQGRELLDAATDAAQQAISQ